MKKLFASIVCLLGVFCSTAQSLPAEADNFIGTFFSDRAVTGVSDFYAPSEFAFRVELDSEVTIYFDAAGKWQLVESFSSDISSILNQKIKAAITEMGNNPVNAVKIRCDENEHTTIVTFNDGASHVFSANGVFLRKVQE